MTTTDGALGLEGDACLEGDGYFLGNLSLELLQAEGLEKTARIALDAVSGLVAVDFGLITFAPGRRLVHIETRGLSWKRSGTETEDDEGEVDHKLLRRSIERCRVLIEGKEVFAREETLESFLDQEGRDRFLMHRLFSNRFRTFLAVPLEARGKVVGEIALGFDRDTDIPATVRDRVRQAAPIIGAALYRADRYDDLQSALLLMGDVSSVRKPIVPAEGKLLSYVVEQLCSYVQARGAVLRQARVSPSVGGVLRWFLISGNGAYFDWARANLPSIDVAATEPTIERLFEGEVVQGEGEDDHEKGLLISPDRKASALEVEISGYWSDIDSLFLLPLGRSTDASRPSYLELHLGVSSRCSPSRLEVLRHLAEYLGLMLNIGSVTTANLELLREQRERLHLLQDLSRIMLVERQLPRYAETVVDACRKHLRAEISTLFLYDKKLGVLRRELSAPSYPILESTDEIYRSDAEGAGITGKVLGCDDGSDITYNDADVIAREAIAARLENYRCLPSWSASKATGRSAPSPVKHVSVAPIVGENGKVFGALRVINKRHPAYRDDVPCLDAAGFTTPDRALLRTIAATLASKLSNERRAAHLEALNVASARIAAANDLGTLARVVTQAIVNDLGYSACSFRELGKDGNLFCRSHCGFSDDRISSMTVEAESGLVGLTLREGRAQVASDVQSANRDKSRGYTKQPFARRERLRGACCVPVPATEGRYFGVIMTYMRGQPYQFFRYEIELLETIAMAASVSFRRIVADEQARQLQERLQGLRTILELLLASDTETDTIEQTFEDLLHLLQADAGAYFLKSYRDEDGDKDLEGGSWTARPAYQRYVHQGFEVPDELVEKTGNEGPQLFRCRDFAELKAQANREFVYGLTFSLRSADELLGIVMMLYKISPADRIEEQALRELAAAVGPQLARTLRSLDTAQMRMKIQQILPAIVSAQLAAGMVHEIAGKANAGENILNGFFNTDGYRKLEEGERDQLRLSKVQFIAIGSLAHHYLSFNRDAAADLELERSYGSINNVVREALRTLRTDLRRARYNALFDPDLEPRHMFFDEQFLAMAVENIIRNALRWIHEGAKIKVTTLRRDGTSVIRVEDWGAGVDKEIADRIFDPFFTNHKGGYGLGLTVARIVVEKYRGRIVLANRRDPTRFEIILPEPSPEELRR